MADPTIAQNGPYEVMVEAGKLYKWCSCGRSTTQPFCDGSHKDTEFKPFLFEAKESGTVFLCGCKRTSDRPWCDGTHDTL